MLFDFNRMQLVHRVVPRKWCSPLIDPIWELNVDRRLLVIFLKFKVPMACENPAGIRAGQRKYLKFYNHFSARSKENVMSNAIPDKYRDLFTKRAFASLGTLMPDGSPQVTPVWCDLEGELVVVNSAKGRQKDKNIRRDPRVALAVIDPENPYRYIEIRGRVVEITEQGADDHIDKMAKKYLGADKYPYRQPGEQRVIFKIRPERTSTMG